MSASVPASVWDVGAQLGEGPVWVARERALYFTDIKKQKIHRFDPAAGTTKSWNAPEQVGFVLPAGSGGFIAGLQSGLHRFDPSSGAYEPLAGVDADLPDNRLNDGVVDSSGRLWFGTMDNRERQASGSFYCFDGGKVRPTGLTGIRITNGPAVSPDGRILYVVDTLGRTIGACEIGDDCSLGPRRPFVRIADADGTPDGPSVDAEGCVWVGLYKGWEAHRYSPAGELLGRVRFPVANITKLAFGGDDLRTVYATTARHLLTPEELEQQPQAGNLFAFRAEVPGMRGYEVAI